MRFKAFAFAIIGALVAAFYGLESFLSFQANGFTPALLVKLAICLAGAYFFVRNVRRIGVGGSDGRPGDPT